MLGQIRGASGTTRMSSILLRAVTGIFGMKALFSPAAVQNRV